MTIAAPCRFRMYSMPAAARIDVLQASVRPARPAWAKPSSTSARAASLLVLAVRTVERAEIDDERGGARKLLHALGRVPQRLVPLGVRHHRQEAAHAHVEERVRTGAAATCATGISNKNAAAPV